MLSAAIAVPQAPAPPIRCLATTGPYTASTASTQAFIRENCTTIAHSQRREMNSRQPTRSSWTRLSPEDFRSPTWTRPVRISAATAKQPASRASTQPGPATAVSRPPSAAPPICEPFRPILKTEIAFEECSGGTAWRITPSAAGV